MSARSAAPTPQGTSDIASASRILDRLKVVAESADSWRALHQALLAVAVDLVDGCDHAALLRHDKGRGGTRVLAATDLQTWDALQASAQSARHTGMQAGDGEAGAGPGKACTPKTLPGLLRSVSVPLYAVEHQRVSLCVSSDSPRWLPDRARDQLGLLTPAAALAASAVGARRRAHWLQEHLDSVRDVGMAVGLLMAMRGVDEAQAIAILATSSQRLDVPLPGAARQFLKIHRAPFAEP